MDQFCLMDSTDGARCSCSDNIDNAKPMIQKINDTQTAADQLYSEGVEREKLGAAADYVFGTGAKAKASGIDFMSWVYGTGTDEQSLDTDTMIGNSLYAMARNYCNDRLLACGTDAGMEEMLYQRMVAADCKTFSAFLGDQQKVADGNKAAAEKAVRAARYQMMDTTNKFNRGECLIAFEGCVKDKGGCGANYENCLDAGLLNLRANACGNILDQCTAVRSYVLDDWNSETARILADAAKYADMNKRGTCLARIEACLETSCNVNYDIKSATDATCLTNINIAAGICPVIDECNAMIPGIRGTTKDNLAFLRVRFCQNDLDKCLQDTCGADYSKPECVGKSLAAIAALCPQEMFPSCKNMDQFDVVLSAAMWQVDFQTMQGCINYFSDQLGRVCGTDMSCLPSDDQIAAMTKSTDVVDWKGNVDAAVTTFFNQFQKDTTIKQCTTSSGRDLGKDVFTTAKMLATYAAEGRAQRAFIARIAELTRSEGQAAAAKACAAMKSGHKDTDNVWISSVNFEPDLCNCHICRVQKVCETGGEDKSTAGLKAAGGGLASGAAAGTMISPGWGTAIGAVVGGVGGYFMGSSGAGTKDFCQELESCEDVNMCNAATGTGVSADTGSTTTVATGTIVVNGN